MAESDYKYDGFISLLSGQHSGLAPHLLQDAYYAKGINVTNRDGVIRTRPGFVQFEELGAVGAEYRGGAVWSLQGGDYFVFVLGAEVKVMDLVSGNVTTAAVSLGTSSGLCYIAQVDRWAVVQDGESRPIVLEEVDSDARTITVRARDAVRDAPFSDEDAQIALVPGTVGLYLHQRYHCVPTKVPFLTPTLDEEDEASYNEVPEISEESGKNVFVSSDVRDVYNPEWVFRMSEHRILNEGGANGLPQELGFITGMSFLRGAQTGTGYGALLLFSRVGVSAFDVGSPRSQWKDIPFSQVLFSGAGTLSHLSTVPVNTDVFYVDTEGYLRSIRYDASRISGSSALYNTPVSNEMRYFCSKTNAASLPYVSGALADNRLVWTLRGEGGFSFPGLGVLDFAPIYGIGGAAEPAFQGVWTGFDFVQVFSARNPRQGGSRTIFAVVRGSSRYVLAYLDEDSHTDFSGTLIESVLFTRAYNFQSPVQSKQLRLAELWVSNLRESSSVSVYYRPYGRASWALLGSRSFNVGSEKEPQFRRRVQFPLNMASSGAACDPITKRNVYSADEFQFGLAWTGFLEIDRFRAAAEYYREEPDRLCAEDNPGRLDPDNSTPEPLEDFGYEVPI